jgi:hypothetical protein
VLHSRFDLAFQGVEVALGGDIGSADGRQMTEQRVGWAGSDGAHQSLMQLAAFALAHLHGGTIPWLMLSRW